MPPAGVVAAALPAVACSPPTAARSSALPIANRTVPPASRLAATARLSDSAAATPTSTGDGGIGASSFGRGGGAASARFSFSSTFTPCSQSVRSLMARSTAAAAAARPPAAPRAPPATVLVGFDAPQSPATQPTQQSGSSSATAAALARAPSDPLSPGRRETIPSLLSLALSDLPSEGSGALAGAMVSDAIATAAAATGASSASSAAAATAAPATASSLLPPPSARLDALSARHPVLSAPVVRAAYAAAARAHAGQARRNGEPALAHCVETAAILAELGMPDEVVAAGLLHGALSDSKLAACELEEYVPRGCVALAEKVARITELSRAARGAAGSGEAAGILDTLTTMADVSALIIKLADRLHDMRVLLPALPRAEQASLATETLAVYSALANRLGAWALRAELEDLAFKTLHPAEYAAVAAAVAARVAAADLPARVAEARAAVEAAGLEAVDVSARAKSCYGVWRKLQAAGLGPESIDAVHDVAALRVVVPHKHDCYVALRAVESLWRPLPGRFKDYVRHRKANGYQSLHTTVSAAPRAESAVDPLAPPLLEVQIRTPKMHYIAEYGFAAHWRYKERLGREDVWLDRLIAWKRWLAADKLGLRDTAKVRAAAGGEGAGAGGDKGGGGAGAADPALAGLAAAAAAAAAGSPPADARDARFFARYGVAPPAGVGAEEQAAARPAREPAAVVAAAPAGDGDNAASAAPARLTVFRPGGAPPLELELPPGAGAAPPALVPS